MHNTSAPQRMVPKFGIPDHPRLLFAGVVPAARRADGVQAVVAPDGSRILEFDESGRFTRSLGDTTLIKAVGINAVRGGWLVTEREGRLVRLEPDGTVGAVFGTPFGSSVVALSGGGLVAARSPFAISTAPVSNGAALLAEAASTGQLRATIDTVIASQHPTSGFLANTGVVATSRSSVFFAFFTRDEIRSYDSRGRLRWISDRSMKWPIVPAVEATESGPSLRYSAVNLGLTVTEDGVHVLSYADSTENRLRLDILDAETGVLQSTAEFERGPWLLSYDKRGALWRAPLDTLFALATERVRPAFPSFTLTTITGDTFDLTSTRGKVTLVNFWASWCAPCREEFPLMNRLAADLSSAPFTIVAVNEDVTESSARRFLREVPATFVVPLGRGKMQSRVGYRGLPFTILLDREGRIIERFFGFGGPAQFQALRTRIDRALAERP